MNNLIIFALVCILMHDVVSAGFDLGSLFNWYNQHHHSSGLVHDSGCDNKDERDHVIRLLTEWHFHHESEAFKKFYSDVILIDMESSAGSLPNSRRQGTRSDAYTNHDTEPDIDHLEHLVRAENMNSQCRMDILHLIERYEHISSMAPVMTTTPKPTIHHTNAPATTKPTVLTPKPTTQAPTTHAQTTHARTTHAPTTLAPLTTTQQAVCDQLTLVSDLANTARVTHPLAGFCADGTRSESEALVLQACSAKAPVQWRQGEQVLGNCENIPRFSPISTFLLGNYVMDGTSLSGVLLECLPNGFKMATQLCGHTPQIYNILSGSTDARQNAGSYYRILW